VCVWVCVHVIMKVSARVRLSFFKVFGFSDNSFNFCWYGVNFINVLRTRFLYESAFFAKT